MRGQNFYFRVYNLVRRIPRGQVATYGQVAAQLGSPRSARMVGWALNGLKPGSAVPWQRVVNKEGRISIENLRATKDMQASLLRAEGVEVTKQHGNFFVDLKRFGWHPVPTEREKE
jgi:methylated-DNA-protein-cysteine methyltransferase-like protein